MELYQHLSIEEAEKLAKEVYDRYTAEVNKKWEQFKKEMKGVPSEILQDMWDEWVELVDEIPLWDILEEYRKKRLWVWIDHEEDIVVTVKSSCFEVEVRDGEVEVHPYDGFRSWKYVEDWNKERRFAIKKAWKGFARLFFPWVEEDKWFYSWGVDSWLELEVYKDLERKGAWKESSYLDVVEFSKFGSADEVPSPNLLQYIGR